MAPEANSASVEDPSRLASLELSEAVGLKLLKKAIKVDAVPELPDLFCTERPLEQVTACAKCGFSSTFLILYEY